MTFEGLLKQMGRNIKAARVRAGLRQIDIEEKVGISYRHYQHIEAGKANVTMRTLYTLAKLFKVSIHEFTR